MPFEKAEPTDKNIELITQFLADPYDDRSVTDFCKEQGIVRSNYYFILNKYRDIIYPEADKRRKKMLGDMRAQAYKSLARRLEKSDKALEMFFEMSGDYVPKSEQRIEYLTPDQKREKLKILLDKISGPEKA